MLICPQRSCDITMNEEAGFSIISNQAPAGSAWAALASFYIELSSDSYPVLQG